jgi:SWI/SNF-related matrix-associated actin-dependent regulator of chromatin subfamily A-like protein 1
MEILCTRCLEQREVKAVIGRMTRLSCGHLMVSPPSDIEKQKILQEILAESKKSEPIIQPTTRYTELSIPPQDAIEYLVNRPEEEIEQAIEIIKNEEIFNEDRFHNLKTKDLPYPFQQTGIEFAIKSNFRCLIADEQGLGKTVQALGVLYYAMKHHYNTFFPCLILAKSNVKMQWMVQILNWLGIEYIPQIIEDGKNPPVMGFNVYIASYDILRRFSKVESVKLVTDYGHEIETTQNTNPFYDFPFKTVIMDEVQAIKGDSKRTGEVKKICQGKNVIALSGTPIKNNAVEYYTILHILAPDKFPTKTGYINRWVKTEVVNGFEKYTGILYPERFAEYTSDIIIRRTRDEVKDEIGLRVTKANRIFYHVDFDNPKLKAAYKAAEAEFIREMEEETKKKDAVVLIAKMAVMRHLVGLNKIQPTVDLAIEFLLEQSHGKLVIFTQHEDVMKAIYTLLGKWCVDGGYHIPLLYHSGLNQQERFDMIASFADNRIGKDTSKHIPFIIGSTLAMGEGVDRLQEVCNDCIIAERQWNPANEEQAESRLVRIGQKKGFVNATYPIASGTIDEYFTDIVERKRKAMKETLEGKTVAAWDETSLLMSLYEAITSKGRSRLTRGF